MVNRRTLLTAAAALPLTGAASVWPTASSAAETSAKLGARGADPRYRLRLAETAIAPFGVTTEARLANGTWPGEPLRFTKGESFRVLVENAMAQPTTLHWHGLIVPNLQDGVPGLTQAPIVPGAALYYAFPLQQSGTYWYHSHVGLQLQQGLSGPLVIEDPDEPLSYDEDITVFLSDLLNQAPDQAMKALKSGGLPVTAETPYRLPNGEAFATDIPYDGLLLNGRPPNDPWIKAVKPGSRVRLRLINGSGSSYFRVALEGLPLLVVAADGEPVAPLEVDNLVIATGQRYDLLVTVPSGGSHRLHAAALGLDKQALGVLHASDSPAKSEPVRPTFDGRALDVSLLAAAGETTLPEGPQRRFEIVLSGDMQRYIWQMNGKSWPEADANFAGIAPDAVFHEITYGERVRLDLVNRTPMVHPMHLHGHVFRVLNEGRDPATAPLRDTVSVPPNGKVSIEFFADNPGQWFFHCHNAWHLAVGMAQAFRYMV
ncbi:MAG: multicopper oxidase family protein [Rhodospirillales bacterium]